MKYATNRKRKTRNSARLDEWQLLRQFDLNACQRVTRNLKPKKSSNFIAFYKSNANTRLT